MPCLFRHRWGKLHLGGYCLHKGVLMARIGIELNTSYLKPHAPAEEIAGWQDDVAAAHNKLISGTGLGADFRGWLSPSELAPQSLLSEVQSVADDLRQRSDALVVIGIGGSYLGARAVIEALGEDSAKPVYFAGNSISADAHARLLKKLEGKHVAVNVISKSGTTTEPAIAFRIFRDWVTKAAGAAEAAKLIVATTDARKGALLKLASDEGYRKFVVPDDVGGRYSVLTPVGLLPIAYAGIDISALVGGAADCAQECSNQSLKSNPAYYYAAARNALYGKGFNVEILSHFEPRLHYFAEWWKQLYGESEGKDNKSLFPTALELTTDLHSMGQYAQQGRRFLIETFVTIGGGGPDVKVPSMDEDLDGLNYLAGRDMNEVNHEAYRATALAHWEGGIPNMTVHLEKLDASSLGALIYFFERACGVSGYLLRVNPFNQPGVEAYKNHMFALLGKPGFEQQTADIRGRVGTVSQGDVIEFGG